MFRYKVQQPSTQIPMLNSGVNRLHAFIYDQIHTLQPTITLKDTPMLLRLRLLFSFGVLVQSYSVLLLSRNDPQLTDGARKALEGVGIDLSKRHVRPKQVSFNTGIQSGKPWLAAYLQE